MLNTNADTIAAETAKAMAEFYEVTLVYCFEKKGVLKDENDDDSVIRHINSDIFKSLVDEGVVSGGMIPKLQNAIDAIDKGVSRVIITKADAIDGNQGTIIEK
jgi:acetylglutamate kinase